MPKGFLFKFYPFSHHKQRGGGIKNYVAIENSTGKYFMLIKQFRRGRYIFQRMLFEKIKVCTRVFQKMK